MPGWLDKALPWRRVARGPRRDWLDNLFIVAPTAEFLRRLPRGKLPDCKDFTYYGQDHDERIANWQRAIGEGKRQRDEFAAFAASPDLARIRPLWPAQTPVFAANGACCGYNDGFWGISRLRAPRPSNQKVFP